jgi:hypothetical protein
MYISNGLSTSRRCPRWIVAVAHALGQTGSLTDAQVRDVLGRGLVEWLELADPPRQSEESLA